MSYFGSRNWHQGDGTPWPEFGELESTRQAWMDGSCKRLAAGGVRLSGSATFRWIPAPPTYQEVILSEPSLAGYWPLHEIGGTVAHDVAHSHDGAYVGTYFLSQGSIGSVKTGSSVLLNGGHIRTPNLGPFPSTAFSFELWMRPSTNANTVQIVIGTLNDPAHALYLYLDVFGGGPGRIQFANGLGGFGMLASAGSVHTATDYHLVVTGSATASSHINAYLNGVLTDQSPQDWSTGGGITINDIEDWGRKFNDSVGNNFIGRMSNLAVYTAELSGGQVLAHYHAGT
jgi:hypothetical protein